MKKSGQNLVELVFVLPLLVFLILGIMELAIYWRNVHVIQETALEASIVASQATISYDTTDTSKMTNKVYALLLNRGPKIAKNGVNFSGTVKLYSGGIYGNAPYSIYEFGDPVGCNPSTNSCNFWARIDYRDPMRRGVSVQIGYKYQSIFHGVKFPIPYSDGTKYVVIIPEYIYITSSKIQQYGAY